MRKSAENKILQSLDKAYWKGADSYNDKPLNVLGIIAMLIALAISLFMVKQAFAEEISNEDTKVFISSHGDYAVDDYLYLHDGAEDILCTGYSYSKDEIKSMLSDLTDRSGSKIDFISAADDVYKWNVDTGADVSAMLALIISEKSCSNTHGIDHWNFFTLTTPNDGRFYIAKGGKKLWNAKKDCKSVGEALTRGMDRIYAWYWSKGQDSFYKMSFNSYGHPESVEEADMADANIFHSYIPWWEDAAYISSGYNSGYAWVNRVSSIRNELKNTACFD